MVPDLQLPNCHRDTANTGDLNVYRAGLGTHERSHPEAGARPPPQVPRKTQSGQCHDQTDHTNYPSGQVLHRAKISVPRDPIPPRRRIPPDPPLRVTSHAAPGPCTFAIAASSHVLRNAEVFRCPNRVECRRSFILRAMPSQRSKPVASRPEAPGLSAA